MTPRPEPTGSGSQAQKDLGAPRHVSPKVEDDSHVRTSEEYFRTTPRLTMARDCLGCNPSRLCFAFEACTVQLPNAVHTVSPGLHGTATNIKQVRSRRTAGWNCEDGLNEKENRVVYVCI